MTLTRITANTAGDQLRIFASAHIEASTMTRTLVGDVIVYGVPGRTSAGKLKVRPGALRFPADLTRVKLTREHNRDDSRGHLVQLDDDGKRIRAAMRVADGTAGDDALREAGDKTRDGFSFDIVDAVVEGDWITAGEVIAIGQVGIPAFDDTRVSAIAASQEDSTTSTTSTDPATQPSETGDTDMTPEQIARLAELRAMDNRTPEQESELAALEALEKATGTTASADDNPPAAPVTASVPAVPSGVPAQRASRASVNEPSALDRFYNAVAGALGQNRSPGAITAALADVTNSANPIAAPAWSGELWSGLQYEPQWSTLFAQGDLTSFEGNGWRWVVKPAMGDYAGDKAAIPSAAISTEPSSYEAARMACGHDIDRKFYDFPDAGFLASYAEAAREDWAVKLDGKARAYALANAVAYGAPATSLLKAAALASFGVKANTRARATFVAVNDGDFLDLLDINESAVPAFLKMFNIDPASFIADAAVPAGEVVAGVKQAATLRTLPGSPIRVDAQHLANGGVDSAFFGYWAIEEHHTSGIVKTTFA